MPDVPSQVQHTIIIPSTDINFEGAVTLGTGRLGQILSADYFGFPVVLKRLQSNTSDANLTRQIEEALKQVISLAHPRILRVFGLFEGHNGMYLVLERAQGSLRDLMVPTRTTAHLPTFFRIFKGITAGLIYLHQSDIVYGCPDLRPENILISASGDPLLDPEFGVIKDALTKITIHKSVRRKFGANDLNSNASYIAPECFEQSRTGVAADVWALGAIMFEFLTGNGLFANNHISELEIHHLFATNSFKFEIQDHVPPQLQNLIHRCLKVNVSERISSRQVMSELISAEEEIRLIELNDITLAPRTSSRSWESRRSVFDIFSKKSNQ